MLAYHGGIRFGSSDEDCPLVLQRDSRRAQPDDTPLAGDWQLVWEGRWAARPDEMFRLYRHAAH
jgi:hypothetical protein